ncbi:MAG: ceramidase domain-containing protein [Proteobacteria bacterium]|nr:ceramidase domain-containing protein [Pseudomonadota bacterium]
MNWSQPVDLYCERLDPSFWAEPLNALTNLSFVIAAAFAFALWRRAGGKDWPVLVLTGVTFAIGIGSFIFHTVATRGAALFDTVPIAVFIYSYLLLALRRLLGLSNLAAFAVLAAFIVLSALEARLVPAGTLNGSHAYLPAFAALVIIGWLSPDERPRRLLLAAAAVLALSIVFRSIDQAVCASLPIGTHFLWHTLNGVVLYLALRAALPSGLATSARP